MTPTLDDKRIAELYREFESMQIELDSDPVAFGLRRLNSKVAEVRTLLTRCEQIALQLQQELHGHMRRLRQKQADYELLEQSALANDPDIRGRSSISDRKAAIASKYRVERQAIAEINFVIQDLTMLITVVNTKRTDLKDTQTRLKDQITLSRDEVNLTHRKWGQNPPQEDKPLPKPNQTQSLIGDDISNMLGAVERLLADNPTVCQTPYPVVLESATVEDLSVSLTMEMTKEEPKVVLPVEPPVPVNTQVASPVLTEDELDAWLASQDMTPPAPPEVKPQDVPNLDLDSLL